MSMTLDELHSECKEAAEDGALVELDALTALTLVEDCIDYNAAIIRLETMLGHGADGGPSMDAMLDQVRAIVADFAALKAVVQTVISLRKAYSAACFRMREGHVSIVEESESAGAAFLRLEAAVEQLASLIDRLEPKRPSPVLEIAGMNHE